MLGEFALCKVIHLQHLKLKPAKRLAADMWG
jgi:hypothetical protein